jgi:hypothetical protein
VYVNNLKIEYYLLSFEMIRRKLRSLYANILEEHADSILRVNYHAHNTHLDLELFIRELYFFISQYIVGIRQSEGLSQDGKEIRRSSYLGQDIITLIIYF